MRGFTLVELAIVMTIIGIIIGGILKGEELIMQAKIKRTIKDVTGMSAATFTFRDKYSTWPGDFSMATTRISGCGTFDAAGSWCDDGNGDSIVGKTTFRWHRDQQAFNSTGDPRLETLMFWKHMALEGLITGVNPGADPNNPVWGQTNPASVIKGGFTITRDDNTGGQGLAFLMRAPVTGPPVANPPHGLPGDGVLTPFWGELLDRKLDDGFPETGWVVGESASTDCDQNSGVNSQYNYHLDQENCLMLFFFNRR